MFIKEKMRIVGSTLLKLVSSRLKIDAKCLTSTTARTCKEITQENSKGEKKGKETVEKTETDKEKHADENIWFFVDIGCFVAATIFTLASQGEIKKAREVGNTIVLGNHQETKEIVLKYFELSDLPTNSEDFNTKVKKCYRYFKLTVTSINGFTGEWKILPPTENAFFLFCHSSKDKFSDDDRKWIIDFDTRTKNHPPKESLLVLSKCLSTDKDFQYNKLGMTEKDKAKFQGNPIFLKPNGDAFGFKLFLLQFPSCLWKDFLIIPFLLNHASKLIYVIRWFKR